VLHGGQSHSVIEGSNVGAGDQVVVQRAANVTFVLPTGTRVRVEEGGDVTVVAQGATQLFRLEAGSVRADVQKLVKGERFVIRTLDAEIEVRGTSFRVANVTSDPTCGAGTTTRLSVYEGVVTVRAGSTETSVPAGATWPADCSSALSADERSRPKPSSHDVQRPLTPAGPSPGALQSASARSQLAEQNDLYGKAIAFRESGDYATAITTFEKLAAKYPSSPLAENAVAERMKLLATMGSGRAAEAARDYIVRYPSGFARADAETILSRGGSDR
jgi:hypothetical protein